MANVDQSLSARELTVVLARDMVSQPTLSGEYVRGKYPMSRRRRRGKHENESQAKEYFQYI